MDIISLQEAKKIGRRVGNINLLTTINKNNTVQAINEINSKVVTVGQKTMVFVLPSVVRQGRVRTELRFPHEGEIDSIYASCGTPGNARTVIQIEKCTQDDYDNFPKWVNILRNNLCLDANKKSSNTSLAYSINDSKVLDNDHFRISVLEVGQGVEDITIEIIVNVKLL